MKLIVRCTLTIRLEFVSCVSDDPGVSAGPDVVAEVAVGGLGPVVGLEADDEAHDDDEEKEEDDDDGKEPEQLLPSAPS